MLRVLLLVTLVTASFTLSGCAVRDYRDAPWDPKPGRALFEQLPNWDDAAQRRCGAHLPDRERVARGMSGHC